ncbi:MAG: SDR family oxidoreductase [Erysipelotrichia bacterium]|jgi:NAD(P)-dependent dehydrogenase (short-subunit alcohol dehydrogenase family)|nr:SDR family oxidoreductase [Erysipelotrichia bacterium]
MKFSHLESINLSHKTILITGANAGLGFEAAKYFASQQAHVIGAVRSIKRGHAAQALILETYPQANVTFLECDLSSKESIEQFALKVISQFPLIDILLNNAGIMAIPYATTKEGFEMQFGVNHLGHFYLTALLFQHLNENARIVNVSSQAHLQGNMDLDDPFFHKKPYQAFKAYAQSKLANLLFTHELNARLHNDSRNIVAVSAHPGVAMTSLFDKVEVNSIIKLLKPVFGLLASSAFQGTKPLIMACLDPHIIKDNYYGPGSKFKPDDVVLSKMSPLAKDKNLAKELWRLSNNLTQQSFLE